MRASAVNHITGEAVEYPATTREEVILSLDEVHATLDTYKLLKGQLNARAAELLREAMEAAKKDDNV